MTVLGDVGAGPLAVAGYGTPDELAIAAIAVKRRGGRRVYCVAGRTTWMASLSAVAAEAVQAHEAADVGR